MNLVLLALFFSLTSGLKIQTESEPLTACETWTWSALYRFVQTNNVPADDMATSTHVGWKNSADARAYCEAHWKTQIDNREYTDGGHYVYVSPSGTKFRASCYWLANMGSSARVQSRFIKDKDTAVTNNYGLSEGSYQPSSWQRRVNFMTTTCAHGFGGDPHVENMNGQKFDILQTGVFSMLSFSDPRTKNLLNLDIEIARVGEECSEAYIRKAIFSGDHVSQYYKSDRIEIQASPDLEVKINDKWTPITAFYGINSSEIVSYSEFPHTMTLLLPGLAVTVDIANWNKAASHDYQSKVREQGWSFLNFQFFGLKAMQEAGQVIMKGLLVDDDISQVTILPDDCKSFYKEETSSSFLSGMNIYN